MAKTIPYRSSPSSTFTASDLEIKVRELEAKVDQLKAALEPFSRMPDNPASPDDAVIYALVRDTGKADIHCGDIRQAKMALKS